MNEDYDEKAIEVEERRAQEKLDHDAAHEEAVRKAEQIHKQLRFIYDFCIFCLLDKYMHY